jgi:hypothetical protein
MVMIAHSIRPHTRSAHRLLRSSIFVGLIGALCVTPATAAHAQFGMLKKIKDKVAGATDTTKKDSTKTAADSTKPKDQSIFSKALGVAGKASDKMEAVTGVSAKDAALAATGAGAANMIAKKVTGAGDAGGLANIAGKALSGGMPGGIPGGMPGGMPGGVPGVNAAQGIPSAQSALQQLGAGQLAGVARGIPALPNGVPGLGAGAIPGQAEMLAFQQEMMQVAMKASTGDALAKARLEAWQALVLRYQTEIAGFQTAAANGDMTVMKKMQDIQLKMVHEWMSGATVKPKKP